MVVRLKEAKRMTEGQNLMVKAKRRLIFINSSILPSRCGVVRSGRGETDMLT